MKKRLIVMCGLPGSGKTTQTERLKSRDPLHTAVISRDKIRFALVGKNERYFSEEKMVFQMFCDEINYWIEDNDTDTIIADATHISINSRAKLLRQIKHKDDLHIVAYVVMPSLLTCLERNAERQGRARVPDSAITRMNEQFEHPRFSEGFAEVVYVDGGDVQ